MTASVADIQVQATARRIYTLLKKAHGRTGFSDVFARMLATYLAKGLHDEDGDR